MTQTLDRATEPPHAPLSTARRSVLAVGMLVVLALAISTAVSLAIAVRGTTPYSYSKTFTPLEDGLDLQTTNAGVTFAVSPDHRVHVRVHGRYAHGKPTVRIVTDGGRTEVITSRCANSWLRSCSMAISVLVPPALPIVAAGTNGSIRASGLTGPTQLTITNGDVRVTGSVGPLALRTTNGSILATGLRSSTTTARTINGTVQLSFDSAPSQAVVSSTNGAVAVAVPVAGVSYRLAVGTTNGAQNTTGVPTEPNATRTVTAHTTNGDVTVRPSG